MSSRLFPTLAIILGAGCIQVQGDTITLKDGSEVTGTILIQSSTKLLVKQGASTRIIPIESVDSVVKDGRGSDAPMPAPSIRASQPTSDSDSFGALNDPVANATVMISATIGEPDVTRPWAQLAPKEVSGSGFVITGNRILTSAHTVEYATNIQVRGNKSGDRKAGHVVAMDTILDLALIALDDATFFSTHPPLQVVPVEPNAGARVSVYSLSENSNNVSVLYPTLATINFEYYTPEIRGIMMRLDTTLDSWMSGGPVAQGRGNVFGMACSRDYNGQTFSFVVPSTEIYNFLGWVQKGEFPGKSMLYDQIQALENPALREYLEIDETQHGAVVSLAESKDAKSLLDWDVVTQISGVDLDDQGNVPYDITFRVNMGFEFQQFEGARPREVVVFRHGQKTSLQITPVRNRAMLIPDLAGAQPSYFILGPVVFSSASTQLLSLVEKTGSLETYLGARGSPLVKRRSDAVSFPGEQLVFIASPFFPHRLTRGYGDPAFQVVKSLNGVPIKNLNDLIDVIKGSTDKYLTIEFAEKFSEILVFSREEMIAATEGIMTDNNLRAQGSPDTMAIWNAK